MLLEKAVVVQGPDIKGRRDTNTSCLNKPGTCGDVDKEPKGENGPGAAGRAGSFNPGKNNGYVPQSAAPCRGTIAVESKDENVIQALACAICYDQTILDCMLQCFIRDFEPPHSNSEFFDMCDVPRFPTPTPSYSRF